MGAMSVEIADVDADGHLDLVTASYADGKIAWFQNDGAVDPAFTENVISTSAAGARDVTTADMDADGDLDILSASYVDDKFAWYENDGSATPSFTERLVSQEGDGPRAVAAADMDGDGDIDVVGASLNDDEVGYFENTDGQMGIQVTAEDTPLTFNAANGNLFSISDVDAGGLEMKVRLEITNGTISLNGITGLTLDIGSGTDDALVEFRGSVTDINAALDGSVFTPTGNFNGIASIRILTDDQGNSGSGGALTDDDTINITVTPVNDAPALDDAGAMDLTSILANSTDPAGDLVAAVIASAGGDRITDPDAGAVEGIAVTAVDDSNGTWEYSTDGGSNWTAFGAVADNSAVVLSATANDRIRFVPSTDYSGNASIDFRAWDTTSGQASGTGSIDTTGNGGTTAFSTATETASITVEPTEVLLWLSTNQDVGPAYSGPPSGVTGLESWSDGTVVGMGDPSLSFGAAATNGTFSKAVDFDLLAGDSNADITGLHYVASDITLTGPGISGGSIDLLAGDMLFITAASENLSTTASGAPAGWSSSTVTDPRRHLCLPRRERGQLLQRLLPLRHGRPGVERHRGAHPGRIKHHRW